MQEKIYARFNLWDNEILSSLNLGVALYQVNQSASPGDVKLNMRAKDPLVKARQEIGRTIQLVYCNPAYVEQSGFEKEELLSVSDVLSLTEGIDLMIQEEIKTLWSKLCQDLPYNGIASWKRPDGRQSIVEFNSIPLSYGENNFILSFYHDITQLFQSQQQLKQMHKNLANICHDLNAPMAMIQQSLFYAQEFPHKIDRSLTWIGNASKHFRSLSNGLITHAQIVNGQRELKPEWVCVSQLCQSLSDVFVPKVQAKNLTFELDLPQAPIKLWIDSIALLRILQNLIGNAVKFTKCGQIKLSCQLLGGAAPGKGIRFCVSDTGIGMSRKDQKLASQPYSSFSSSTDAERGHGLGLSIAKELVALMQGSLEIKSALNQGTTLSINLPQTGYIVHE